MHTRQFGPLPAKDAESLLRKPVPDFPDSVFDDACTQAVLAATGTHPFWIQAVGQAIVVRLRDDDRQQASVRDVEAAIDTVVTTEPVLPELWDLLTDDERALLAALALGEAVERESAAFESLREQYFIEESEEGPRFMSPLFARWIRRNATRATARQ